MPFCAACGTALSGPFCSVCGRAAGDTPSDPDSVHSLKRFKPQHWAAVVVFTLIDVLYLHWWWPLGLVAAVGSVYSWIDFRSKRTPTTSPDAASAALPDPATSLPPAQPRGLKRGQVVSGLALFVAVVVGIALHLPTGNKIAPTQ